MADVADPETEWERPDRITYGQAFKSWLSFTKLQDFETRLLSYLPFYPESDGSRKAMILDVPIDKKSNSIHEFYIENLDNKGVKPDERHVVLVHGYGAALGFFYKNFDGLSSIPGIKIHALDLLGYGLSSRSHFPKIDPKTPSDVQAAEDFFVDSIEAWRKERQIDNFVLVGHSLGGYLSSCYYLKYGHKGIVNKLVLVSPVGVERNDFSMIGGYSEFERNKEAMNDTVIANAEGPSITRELTDTQTQLQNPSSTSIDTISADNISISSNTITDAELQAKMDQVRLNRRTNYRGWLVKLWENHVSPFSILRSLGPFAPRLVSRWTFSRFSGITDPNELMDVQNYAYKTFVAKGSGEHALTRILAPGAVARLPLLDRIPKTIQVPSLWLYGDHDWMSKADGRRMVREINESEGASQHIAKFRVIDFAGHHLYADNVPQFNDTVRKFLGW